MMKGRSGSRRAGVLALLASTCLVAAACGSAAPSAKPAATAPAKATPAVNQPAAGNAKGQAAAKLTHVTFQLPWLVTGYDGAFVAAQAKGYYKKQGLAVTIAPSKGSLVTAEDVANGNFTFGFTDVGTVAKLISSGADLKVVGSLVQESPVDFIYNPGTSIPTAASLKGKTVITDVGGATQQLLPAVLKKGHLTMKDIHFVAVSASALAASLKSHPHALLGGFVNALYPPVLKLDPKAESTLYSKFGVNTLSLGLITTTGEISAHPGLVRRFVAASVQGWQFMQAHPKQTVQMTLKAFPTTNAFILQKSLQFTLPLVHTPASKGKPLGWMAASDWTTTLQLMHQYAGLKAVKPLSDYYTNKYLPAQ